MDVKEYQTIIEQTAIYPKDIGLLYCGLGLSGESGEVADKIKKIYRDKKGVLSREDSHDIAKEMGDCLWYITALCNEVGFTLQEVMEMNYNKLIKRRETGTIQGSGDNREETNEEHCIISKEGVTLCEGQVFWHYDMKNDIVNPMTVSKETFKNRPVHIFQKKENAYLFKHDVNYPKSKVKDKPRIAKL